MSTLTAKIGKGELPVKTWEEITEEERDSGRWVKGRVDKHGRFVPHASEFWSEGKRKREQKREEYLRQVAEKKASGKCR